MELQQWTATLTASVSRVAVQILEYLPSVLGATVLLLAGWGLARLLRYATAQITERTLARLARTRPMDTRVQQPRSYSAAPAIASRIVFWMVMLFAILAATQVLQLQIISSLLAGVTNYLPRLIAGLLILFIGLWFAEVTRAILKRSARNLGIEHGDIVGRLGQTLVLLIVFSIAAGQIGIDNSLLVALVVTLFAVVLGALALAFALGARVSIENLLAAQSVAQTYGVGDRVRIGDIEGRILRITRTGVIVETADGRTLIPARRFSHEVSVQVSRDEPA